jgi:phosphate transport system permease protein
MSLSKLSEETLSNNLPKRHKVGLLWMWIFQASTILGILALVALIFNILNGVFGYAAIQYKIDPSTLSADGLPIEQMEQQQLIQLIQDNISKGLFRQLERERPLTELSLEELQIIIDEKVLEPEVKATWPFWDSIVNQGQIKAEAAEKYPNARLTFRTWMNGSFVSSPQSSKPLQAGVRTAILGSLWTILITIIVVLPIGVGAAIYLEEFASATKNNFLRKINGIFQTNINNLAGVPSIIYGILGLAIFVRMMEPVTSGAIFGIYENQTSANGRTLLSAGLTLALLVLPLLIINSQEAIRAVPSSLRDASYALGATKWQTVWHNVLPNALPGILTGTILSMSRAIGETAPLVVVGASTFITFDPDGPFSKFTTLPIQIYQWTTRPQDEFRNLAAAAILVLLVLLLTMNAIAIVLRNRYSRKAL